MAAAMLVTCLWLSASTAFSLRSETFRTPRKAILHTTTPFRVNFDVSFYKGIFFGVILTNTIFIIVVGVIVMYGKDQNKFTLRSALHAY